MQNKLLPCPFCGGEAKYIEDKDFFVSRFVTCTKCGIETRRNYLRKDLAINAWNTRKPMERIVEQLESLVEYNSEQAEIYHNVEKEDAYTREMKDLYIDRVNCYGVALRIVKGGVEDATN